MYRSIRLAVLVLLAALTSRSLSAEWLSDVQNKMGTRVEVQLWSEDATAGEPLLGAAMAEFDRIEAAMSTYRPESEISRVNRRAAAAPVTVSPEVFALVDRALQLSMTTGGAFDISYDSVGQLYDYRAGVRPADADIQASLPAIDYRHIELDRTALAIRFSRPGVRIKRAGFGRRRYAPARRPARQALDCRHPRSRRRSGYRDPGGAG
jgi:thiamine biosynthesis lipoprotein